MPIDLPKTGTKFVSLLSILDMRMRNAENIISACANRTRLIRYIYLSIVHFLKTFLPFSRKQLGKQNAKNGIYFAFFSFFYYHLRKCNVID